MDMAIAILIDENFTSLPNLISLPFWRQSEADRSRRKRRHRQLQMHDKDGWTGREGGGGGGRLSRGRHGFQSP